MDTQGRFSGHMRLVISYVYERCHMSTSIRVWKTCRDIGLSHTDRNLSIKGSMVSQTNGASTCKVPKILRVTASDENITWVGDL